MIACQRENPNPDFGRQSDDFVVHLRPKDVITRHPNKKHTEKTLQGCFNTANWNTPLTPKPLATSYNGIPFIVGVAGGLPIGCAISGCVVIFLETPNHCILDGGIDPTYKSDRPVLIHRCQPKNRGGKTPQNGW